jgi:uncharacterized phage-associated protein
LPARPWPCPGRRRQQQLAAANSDWPAHQLSELTHREAPWRDARAGLAPGERGDREISQAVLYEFYDGLTTADQ